MPQSWRLRTWYLLLPLPSWARGSERLDLWVSPGHARDSERRLICCSLTFTGQRLETVYLLMSFPLQYSDFAVLRGLSMMALLCSVDVRISPLKLCFYLLFYVFLLSLFTHITSALFIYDKRTLLDIGHRYTNLLQDTLSTNPTWILEILLGRWTKATWITPGGERNTAGNALESATDWGKGLTVLLYRVFWLLMSNTWRIRWTILELE